MYWYAGKLGRIPVSALQISPAEPTLKPMVSTPKAAVMAILDALGT